VALLAALGVAVVAGLAWRATNGRMRPVAARTAAGQQAAAPPAAAPPDAGSQRAGTGDAGPQGRPAPLPTAAGIAALETPAAGPARGRPVTAEQLGQPLGERATLLQFSSAFCAPCRATRVILADVAGRAPGVAHVEIDAESHLDLVRALGVLRTPTVFVLAADGAITARASGQPRKADVLGALGAALPDVPATAPAGSDTGHAPA
jgi:thiol-disulfide isomerase/thioredoxin